jgi:hypothetical protein
MLGRFRAHLQSNIVGYIALFIALSGSAYAVTKAPKDSVTSKSIKKGAVTRAKIAKNAVTSRAIKDRSVKGVDIDPAALANTGHATSSDTATNADRLGGATPESFLKGADPFTGGDLTGTHAEPTIGPGTIDSGKIADGSIAAGDVGDNALTGTQINESSLAGVDAAKLGGRSSSAYVVDEGQTVISTARAQVNTVTVPINTTVMSATRYKLVATGTPHEFKVCGANAVTTTQFFAIVHGDTNATIHQSITGNACGSDFLTGGNSTASVGNFTVFGPDAVMFGGPSTASAAGPANAALYSVFGYGSGIDLP